MKTSTRISPRIRPLVEAMEGRMLLNAGGLDTTFGGTGLVTTSLQSGTSYLNLHPEGLAIQSDLKTVAVGLDMTSTGHSDSTFIARYNVNGSLDTTFGNGGEVNLATSSYPDTSGMYGRQHAAAVAIQADGKIVVETNTTMFTQVQTSSGTTYTATSSDLLVIRLNPNGSLDTTFGNGGEADLHLAQGNVMAGGVAILPGGQILVAGSKRYDLAGPEYLIARLTSSGSLDNTFGPYGQGYNETGYASSNVISIVDTLGLDASGNVLLAGLCYIPASNANRPQVVRYTPNGLLDTSFANQGVFDYPTLARGFNSIGFQPGGQIILGMQEPNVTNGSGVIRLTSNGTIDTTFGSNGSFWDPNGAVSADIAIQPDGKILMEMDHYTTSNVGQILVDRLLPGGSLDSSFGTGGSVVSGSLSSGVSSGGTITVGPDGKITALSTDVIYGTNDCEIEMVRLLGDPITTGQLVVTQQPPSSLVAGAPFGLTVQVVDRSGNVEPSYNGPVTVGIGSGPGGATLGGTTTVNAINGVATFSGLALTSAASNYTLWAYGTSLGDAFTTAMIVSPSTASQVVFTQQPPTSVIAGTSIALQAAIEDQYGNIETGAGNAVTLALANNPGGATLGGTLTATASNGVATFSGLTLTKAATGYTFQVASGGLGGSVSGSLAVTPAAASRLLITQQPTSVVVNIAFTLVAEIVDAYGNVVTSANNSVTIALGNNPTGAKLGGTLTATAKNGIVTFSGLKLSKVGTGYTILISSNGLTGTTSGPINVTAS